MRRRACIRTCLLWSARWLIRRASGRSRGLLEIEIRDPATSDRLLIVGHADTRKVAPWEEASSALPGGDTVLAFSDDDARILMEIKRAGAIPLKELIRLTGLEKSKCATLAANLKARAAIETTDDGYSILHGKS